MKKEEEEEEDKQTRRKSGVGFGGKMKTEQESHFSLLQTVSQSLFVQGSESHSDIPPAHFTGNREKQTVIKAPGQTSMSRICTRDIIHLIFLFAVETTIEL